MTEEFMPFDHIVSLVSASMSFIGLIFVAVQLRSSNRQRELESIVKLYDINRQLITLGFSHPALLEVLEDKEITHSLSAKRYLQLWPNQLSLSHSFLKRSVAEPELQDELRRNLVDFMGMKNMQKHWQHYGSFYPTSFQVYVNDILKKDEPPKKAAHVKAG